MGKTEFIKIKCPHCGWEYLPCEIFYPKDFLGDADNIIRDEEGKIVSFTGNSMILEEEFVCEHCDTKFTVEAKVEFTTKKEDDWDEEYSTSIFSEDRIQLEE